MAEPSADIQILQDEFQEVHDAILNVMDQLSGAGNPIASITVQDISAIKNSLQILEARVSGKIQTGKRQLKALVGIGHVINSSLGLSKVLDEVMDTVIDLMRAERGFLMLRDHEGELTIEAARAIDQIDLKWDNFSLSKTIVHQVAETSEPVLTTNAQEDPRFESQKSVLEHNLRSVLCVPLKSKDEVIGVIFVDSRVKTGLFKADDLEMLSAFANQATVAIENARLFDSLQGANKELKDAYINTLKGWALALEMRDRETEGHTTRVTALTLKLAKKIGVKENDLEHIEQGALLHDIGKFAITDNILLKRGDLTSAERKIMEYHPKYAKEMLEKIDFLLPAIDIPYHHHEKWDGSGYPQGLMGEEIPFSARIFAIVDVWDALTSDRPYRKPMQPKEVRRIIREKSGSHFDPKVVDSFLDIDNLPIPPRPKGSQII